MELPWRTDTVIYTSYTPQKLRHNLKVAILTIIEYNGLKSNERIETMPKQRDFLEEITKLQELLNISYKQSKQNKAETLRIIVKI